MQHVKTTLLRIPDEQKTYVLTSNQADAILQGVEQANGYYEPHLMRWIQKNIAADAICMDVGANLGAISIAMAHQAKQGIVYAFEPSAHNYRYLSFNVHHNQMHNIVPIQAGAYDENIELTFSYVDFGGGWSHITTPHSRHGIQEVVPCVRLDDWMKQANLHRLDCIKIDVEGAETRVLKGAENLLRQLRPHVLIEFNPDAQRNIFGEDPEQLYNALKQLCPRLSVINFDGSIVPIHQYADLQRMFADGRQLCDLWGML
ncbi:FkbM family methyltransferase [Paenibacillus sp. SC116]|uniref:FkbM family methyltransferase n=1 Tax=Paenibacillus sp. SC116 TaxID=2968986 RepID=UPI00215B18A7|nr:FkbM family methyltransferase [Paenibacillus sp. SC116]MCR8843832.1 FkbM family methyltransferase [Paenibacillus sp. SC116]